ncbi:uncharacterized protein METZ01_LOCUS18764 [marine metagenome]|uniref:Uncharacterized protein n=1 Tax=marine metagenome TaxID=408172 RepID=A0A381PG48_9ZZZZ
MKRDDRRTDIATSSRKSELGFGFNNAVPKLIINCRRVLGWQPSSGETSFGMFNSS